MPRPINDHIAPILQARHDAREQQAARSFRWWAFKEWWGSTAAICLYVNVALVGGFVLRQISLTRTLFSVVCSMTLLAWLGYGIRLFWKRYSGSATRGCRDADAD